MPNEEEFSGSESGKALTRSHPAKGPLHLVSCLPNAIGGSRKSHQESPPPEVVFKNKNKNFLFGVGE